MFGSVVRYVVYMFVGLYDSSCAKCLIMAGVIVAGGGSGLGGD